MIWLQLAWVAAHIGLRARGAEIMSDRLCNHPIQHVFARHALLWDAVHDITRELDYPPAPMTMRAR